MKFRSQPREDFLKVVAMHAAENWHPNDFKRLLEHSFRTFDHFPSIAQLEAIATDTNIVKPKWKYFEVEHCAKCGGVGWYWIETIDQKGICGCTTCAAGQNLLNAPSPHKLKPFTAFRDAVFSAPGRKIKSHEVRDAS